MQIQPSVNSIGHKNFVRKESLVNCCQKFLNPDTLKSEMNSCLPNLKDYEYTKFYDIWRQIYTNFFGIMKSDTKLEISKQLLSCSRVDYFLCDDVKSFMEKIFNILNNEYVYEINPYSDDFCNCIKFVQLVLDINYNQNVSGIDDAERSTVKRKIEHYFNLSHLNYINHVDVNNILINFHEKYRRYINNE